MQKALIHCCDFICSHFDAASVYKSNAGCVRQSTRDKYNGKRLLVLCCSLIQAIFYKMNLYVVCIMKKKAEDFHQEDSTLLIFFVLDFIFSSFPTSLLVPPGIRNISIVAFFHLSASPLVNLSCCWSRWHGLIQIWYTSWERDYGSVPSTGIQKIQAVKDF